MFCFTYISKMMFNFQVMALLLAAFFCLIHNGTCCSCMKSHPQKQFCGADFVILARVKKYQNTSKDFGTYKVAVKREFKMSEKSSVALKSGRIHTAIDDALCGVSLSPHVLYVLSGRTINLKARIYLCDMIMEWKDLTYRQKKGLRLLYKQGCSCKLSPYKINTDGCQYKDVCDDHFGICTPQRNGSCHWIRNSSLTKCRYQHRNATLSHSHSRKNQIS